MKGKKISFPNNYTVPGFPYETTLSSKIHTS